MKLRILSRPIPGLLALLVLLVAGSWVLEQFRPQQKLAGRLVDYHEIYDGLWDVACDTAMDGSDRRCYLQYVDVYRPRPDFAAAMVEVMYLRNDSGQSAPYLRFDIEPGLSFSDSRLAVRHESGKETALDTSDCAGNTCYIRGSDAINTLEIMREGEKLELEIGEGRAVPANLSWPLAKMAQVLDDFAHQRRLRKLP